MFKLSPTPLGSLDLKNEFVNPQAGAFACFEGWVRDHNEGKKVKSLSYEAYEALCLAEAEKIFGQAKKQFSIFEAKCYHRVGYLKIGEMAVWVGVTAAHREDAFKACRYLIDEVKARLPIWKKEYYANGDSGWVGCEHCGLHPSDHPHHETQVSRINESAFYSRQTILPEIGAEGQAKLKQAKVLVVGAGGLGSACLTALAQVGIGTIGICEFDRLEASNLHRQSLYSHEDVGKPKIDLAVNRIKSINPFIIVKTHPEKLNVENIEAIIRDYDLLVDGTDNFVTKFLLNDASVIFKKPLVQASIYQFEGQLRVYDPASPSACLRCLWPKMPPPGCVDNCAQAGVLGIVPNVLGNLEAFEAIKYFLKLPGSLTQEHLIFDFTSYSLLKLKSGPSLNCPLCGNNPAIRAIESKNYSFVFIYPIW